MMIKQQYRQQISILWIISFFFSLSFVSSQRPEVVQHPETQSLIKGRTVIFHCKVTNIPALARDPVQWVHNGLGLGHKLLMWPRYFLVGDHSVGEYNLKIENVQPEDEGSYECQVVTIYNNVPVTERSEKAHLNVWVPPTGPIIPNLTENNEYKVIAGQSQSIPCHAYNAKPAATVEWKRGKDTIDTAPPAEISNPSNSLYNTTALLPITPKPIDETSDIIYTCVIKSIETMQNKVLSKTIRLKLMYRPEVKLQMASTVDEKSDVIAKCISFAADPPVSPTSFRWFKNGQEIARENTNQLVIPQVDRNWRGAEISCQSHNEAGYSNKATSILDVEYAPILHNITNDITCEIGDSIELECWWDSHPSATVTWSKKDDPNGQILSYHNTYVIDDVTQANSASYVCRASSPIGSNEKIVEVQVRGPPVISSNPLQSVVLGKDVSIDCHLSTSPGIDKVVWSWKAKGEDVRNDDEETTKNNQEQSSSMKGRTFELRSNNAVNKGGKIKYQSLLMPGEDKAKLRIYNVDQQDIDIDGYTCEVSNNYGTTRMVIKLEKTTPSAQQSDSNIIAIVCGVVGGIILMLLTFVGLHCMRSQKQHKSTNFGEEFTKALPLSTTEAEMIDDKHQIMKQTTMKESQQRAPTADDDLSDDNPRASVTSSHDGDVPISSCSTSNEGNPTPTSVHDDGYHTEAGSWNPRHGSMMKPSIPISRLPTISAQQQQQTTISVDDSCDRNSIVSDVNYPPPHHHHIDGSGVTLRSMSAMQQPYTNQQQYNTTRQQQNYDPIYQAPSSGRSASVLAERLQQQSPPLTGGTQYYPRDYAPLLPMAEAYPLDRLYGSSQSSLEKYERSSLLGSIPSTTINNQQHLHLVNKNVNLRMNQSSRGSDNSTAPNSTSSGSGGGTTRPRMATHV